MQGKNLILQRWCPRGSHIKGPHLINEEISARFQAEPRAQPFCDPPKSISCFVVKDHNAGKSHHIAGVGSELLLRVSYSGPSLL